MPFFDRVDGMGLIERHIRRVTGLELEQSRALLREYTKARQEIMGILSATPNQTFTEAQLEITLAQVDTAITALERRIVQETEEGVEIMTEQASEDTVKEINRFEKEFRGVAIDLPVASILESIDSQNLLLNRYQGSIRNYHSDLRNQIQRELTQLVIQRTPYFTAIGRVGELLPHFRSPIAWQVQRIVRTELHNVYNVAKMGSFQKVKEQSIPDLKKTQIHAMDGRTGEDSKAMAKADLIVAIDKPFKFKFRGKQFVFMAPPSRPNDRAILVPYRKAWDQDTKGR